MTARSGLVLALLIGTLGAGGCIDPEDRRPGLWLRGEPAEPPADWSFTGAHPEIAIEVRTPYLLRHSVTIWCAAADGRLYVGARSPETKRWPGWVDDDPVVRLGIEGSIYRARLVPLDDPAELERVGRAYTTKYDLPPRPAEGAPSFRYWRVEPRG